MKQKNILKDQSGVIHHLGLIVFGVLIVGAVGFAVYRIQHQDPNYGYVDSNIDEDDATQFDLESASDSVNSNSDESDNELTQVSTKTEENDAN